MHSGTRNSARRTPRRDWRPQGVEHNRSAWATLRRTVSEYSEDNMGDWAASLTYYGLLALFPALIALVAIVGLVGNPTSTTNQLIEIVGTVAALYSASSYVAAFARASNIIWETPEGRPAWKLKPQQMLVTLIILVLLIVSALSLVLTGPVVDAVAKPLGISSAAVSVWNIAKWPVLVLFMILIFTILYYASPNVKLRGLRWVAPGAAFALLVWAVASAAFAVYVANFGSYNKTYGTLGGFVVFLVWMWLTNVALLMGAQLNSERERNAELAEGVPRAERELQMQPRNEPKAPHTS